jgi:hypothetical protein
LPFGFCPARIGHAAFKRLDRQAETPTFRSESQAEVDLPIPTSPFLILEKMWVKPQELFRFNSSDRFERFVIPAVIGIRKSITPATESESC